MPGTEELFRRAALGTDEKRRKQFPETEERRRRTMPEMDEKRRKLLLETEERHRKSFPETEEYRRKTMSESNEKRSRFSDTSPSHADQSIQSKDNGSHMRKPTRYSRMMNRRINYGFDDVPVIKYDKGSFKCHETRRPVRMFLNTYQLEPKKRFNSDKVTKIINDILDEAFDDHVYSAELSPGLAVRIAGESRRRVKQERYDRYRFISVVTIGQNVAQSYNNAIAFLWDHTRDNFVNINRKITTGFIQVSLFGVYLD